MRPFEISFDFPVASTKLKISLNATAELHHSEPYFVVQDFYLASTTKRENEHHSVLPAQEIKRIRRDDEVLWVHKDSEETSELSIALGKAIEKVLTEDQLENLDDS